MLSIKFCKLLTNRTAKFHYTLGKHYIGGVQLRGWEVKSIKSKQLQLQGSYLTMENGELWWLKLNISPLPQADLNYAHPQRPIKILLNRRELKTITTIIQEKQMTLVPINILLSKRLIKLEFAAAKGKKLYDKRAELKRKDLSRS